MRRPVAGLLPARIHTPGAAENALNPEARSPTLRVFPGFRIPNYVQPGSSFAFRPTATFRGIGIRIDGL